MNSNKGYIYIRGEYNEVTTILRSAIDEAYKRDYWARTFGLGFDFELDIYVGAGGLHLWRRDRNDFFS
ncbi:MAG: hypothetical protein R2827_15440 [Bdellovibrionales bacterium]